MKFSVRERIHRTLKTASKTHFVIFSVATMVIVVIATGRTTESGGYVPSFELDTLAGLCISEVRNRLAWSTAANVRIKKTSSRQLSLLSKPAVSHK